MCHGRNNFTNETRRFRGRSWIEIMLYIWTFYTLCRNFSLEILCNLISLFVVDGRICDLNILKDERLPDFFLVFKLTYNSFSSVKMFPQNSTPKQNKYWFTILNDRKFTAICFRSINKITWIISVHLQR